MPLMYVQHAGEGTPYLANPMGLSERGVYGELGARYWGEEKDGGCVAPAPPQSRLHLHEATASP